MSNPQINIQTGLMETYLYGNRAVPLCATPQASQPFDFGGQNFGFAYLTENGVEALMPDSESISGWTQRNMNLSVVPTSLSSVYVEGKTRLFGMQWLTNGTTATLIEIVYDEISKTFSSQTVVTNNRIGMPMGVVFQATQLNGEAVLFMATDCPIDEGIFEDTLYIYNVDSPGSDPYGVLLDNRVNMSSNATTFMTLVSGTWGDELQLVILSGGYYNASLSWTTVTFQNTFANVSQSNITLPGGGTYTGYAVYEGPEDSTHTYALLVGFTGDSNHQNLYLIDENQNLTAITQNSCATFQSVWVMPDIGSRYSIYAQTSCGLQHCAQQTADQWQGDTAFSPWTCIDQTQAALPLYFDGRGRGAYAIGAAPSGSPAASYTVGLLYRVDDADEGHTTYKWRDEWVLVSDSDGTTTQAMAYRTSASVVDGNGNLAPIKSGTVSCSNTSYVSINGVRQWIEANTPITVETNAMGQVVIEQALWSSLWTPHWTFSFLEQNVNAVPDQAVLSFFQNLTQSQLDGLDIPAGTNLADLVNQVQEVAKANGDGSPEAYRLHLDYSGKAVLLKKTTLSKEERQRMKEANVGIFGLPSFSDILNGLRNGVDDIESVAITVVDGAAQVAMTVKAMADNAAEYIYQDILIGIQGVNDLFSIIGSLFMKLGQSLENIFKWATDKLGGLFSWKAVLTLKTEIKTKVISFLNTLPANVDNEQEAFNKKFQNMSSLQDTINALPSEVKNASFSSLTGNSLQDILGDDWSKATWLFDKLHLLLKMGGELTNPGLAAMDTLIDTLGTSVKSDFPALTQLATATATVFAPYTTTPSQWLSASPETMATLWTQPMADGSSTTLAEGYATGVLAVSDALFTCANGVLGEMQTLKGGLIDPIDVPILSGWYKFIANDSLSMLDLICLIIAVPLHVAENIVSLEELTDENSDIDWGAVEKWVGLFAALAGKILTITENVASNKKLVIFACILTLVLNGSSWGLAKANSSSLTGYWYAKTVYGFIDWLFEYKAAGEDTQAGWIVASRFALCFINFIVMVGELGSMGNANRSAYLTEFLGMMNACMQFIVETTPAGGTAIYNGVFGASSALELYLMYEAAQ